VTRNYIAPDSVLAVRPGGRCPHCLGAIYQVDVGQPGEWLSAERVGEHYEVHDCVPRGWYPAPAAQRIV
jgi:hypothetical protein